jgi:glutaredoxin
MSKFNYFIKAILLENCPYSRKAKHILEKYNIPCKIINVDYMSKNNYKTDKIITFPQLYLNKYNSNGNLLLGGYDDLKFIISNFRGKNNYKINNFIEKYKWSLNATKHLIELVNLN